MRQYFSINDNFTADYVSKAMGETSHMIIRRDPMGRIKSLDSDKRMLATQDEVRRYSGVNIFAFMGEKPPTIFAKSPYYRIQALNSRADINPYI